MTTMRFTTFMAALALVLGMMLFAAGMPTAYAQCANGDAGDNTLDCTTGDPDHWVGLAGSDTMTNADGSVIVGSINSGDDNDTIINNGEVGLNLNGGGDSGDDTIINNGTVGNSMAGGDGVDTLTNNGTVVTSVNGGGGNDMVVNNGDIGVNLSGGDDDDTVINNGTVGNGMNGGEGNDTVINNGTVVGNLGDNVGQDTVINNGSVGGNIFSGESDDTIVNNGSVAGIVNGGVGNDEITINGSVGANVNGFSVHGAAGNDTVTLTENADVAGIVNGGADTDTLIFNMQFESTADGFAALEAQVEAWAAELAAANPNGGTIVIAGKTYEWRLFEDLVAVLRANLVMFSDGRLNPFDLAATAVVYCDSGDVVIYTPEGEQALRVPAASLMGASAQTVVAEALGISLSAMPADVALVIGPGGYVFDFSPALCVIN